MVTKEEIKAGLEFAITAAQMIQLKGEISSGELHATLGLSIENYEALLRLLTNNGFIKQMPNHLIVWTGPKRSE